MTTWGKRIPRNPPHQEAGPELKKMKQEPKKMTRHRGNDLFKGEEFREVPEIRRSEEGTCYWGTHTRRGGRISSERNNPGQIQENTAAKRRRETLRKPFSRPREREARGQKSDVKPEDHQETPNLGKGLPITKGKEERITTRFTGGWKYPRRNDH